MATSGTTAFTMDFTEVAEEAFEHLDGPLMRITAPDTPVPFSPPLEKFFLPKTSDVIRVARHLAAY